MLESKYASVMITKVSIGGSDPITDPEQVLTQVWDDDSNVIAEHRSNPNLYQWSQMLVFASYCASKGYKENEITKEILVEWLNMEK